MFRRFYEYHAGRTGAALLLLRLLAGTGLIFHGWPKVQNLHAFADMFRLPLWAAALAAYTEVIGGALLILGLLTPLAALFIAGEMAVALLMVHFPAGDPFVNPQGRSFELAALYFVIALTFLLAGPGLYSADACLAGRQVVPVFGRRRGTAA